MLSSLNIAERRFEVERLNRAITWYRLVWQKTGATQMDRDNARQMLTNLYCDLIVAQDSLDKALTLRHNIAVGILGLVTVGLLGSVVVGVIGNLAI